MNNYPHELSGGMQQRVIIAMALSSNPALLILDEPTTGLDATVEAEVLDLIERLRAELRTSVLFISHSLAVIGRMCDRIGVLYAGELVEEGAADETLSDPRHPYTVALLRCVPKLGQSKNRGRLETIPGFLPTPGSIQGQCVFVDRCGNATDRCRAEAPPPAMQPGRLGERLARCFYPERAQALPRHAGGADQGTPPPPPHAATPPLLRTRESFQDLPGGGQRIPGRARGRDRAVARGDAGPRRRIRLGQKLTGQAAARALDAGRGQRPSNLSG